MNSHDTKADAPVCQKATADGLNPHYENSADRGVTISRSAQRAALRVAEKAADEVIQQLRDAEQERDQLARRIGSLQARIDALGSDREYHTRLVRGLLAATESREFPA